MNGELSDYQKLFDSISVMVFVITDVGDILAVNRTTVERLGYSREELLTMNVLLLHPVGSEREVERVLDALILKGESLCTLPLVSKCGKLLDVETRIYKGVWEGMEVLFGFSSDVTKQKAFERKFEAIFAGSPIPIAVSSIVDGRLVEVNDAWCNLVEFQRDMVIGKTTQELGVWVNPEERLSMIEALANTSYVNGYPVHFRSLQGKSIYGLLSASKLIVDDEELWITSLVDHTEQKLLEQQLDEMREATLSSAKQRLQKQLSKNKYIRG